MKHCLTLATVTLALSSASQVLAAESETAAPAERAAPSRTGWEVPTRVTPRAMPARQVARPAAAQQTAPAQSSWTGSQVGGFGGGNVGGGGFSDPMTGLCAKGFNPPSTGGLGGSAPLVCPQVPFDFSNHGSGGTGGGYYTYSIPFGDFVVGVEGDVAGGNVKSSSTQTNRHLTNLPGQSDGSIGCVFPSCQVATTETFAGSITEGTNGSVRARFGVPIYNGAVLAFVTAGVAFGKVSSSFSYFGCNVTTPAIGSPIVNSCGGGAASFSQTRMGPAIGGGLDFAFIPGVKLRAEYRYTSYGHASYDVPLALTFCSAPPCTGTLGNAHIDLNHIAFHTFRFGAGIGF